MAIFTQIALLHHPPNAKPISQAGDLRQKNQPQLRLVFSSKWWSWRELNPRPQAFVGQIYMFSALIYPHTPPRTGACSAKCQHPKILCSAKVPGSAPASVNVLAAGRYCYPLAQPTGVLLQGSPVFKRRVRNVRRLQLL